jgi:hypothetical protein
MIRALILVLLVLPLSSMAQEQRTVTVHEIQSTAALQRKYRELVGKSPVEKVQAFARWTEGGDWCDLYVVKARPSSRKARTDWGHELLHCFKGHYHK